MRLSVLVVFPILLVWACAASEDTSRAALEERVRRLEGEKEIRELLALYGEHLDAKDYAGYASLFASDGVSTTGFGSATGPEAIETLLTENLGKPEPGYINEDRFHLMTTVTANVSGDMATARSRYTVFAASQDGRPVAVHSGRYIDKVKRENGLWKFSARVSHGVIPYREPAPSEMGQR